MNSPTATLWDRFISRAKTGRRTFYFTRLAASLLLLALGLNACSTLQPNKDTDQPGAGLPTPDFDGDWRGSLKTVTGPGPRLPVQFRIVIHGDTALACEFEDGEWKEVADNTFNTVRYKISRMGDLYVVNWVNQGMYYDWSEEQTYSLSYITARKVKIVQLRHVTNREKGKNGVPWFYVCVGNLVKTADH